MIKSSGNYEVIKMEESKDFAYYTFTPLPLCNNRLVSIDEELTSLLSKAHRLLGILEGITMYAPNMDIIEEMLIYNEAYLSCRIDGIDVPFLDLFSTTKKKSQQVNDILNYAKAVKFLYRNTKEEKIPNELLCRLHGILMSSTSETLVSDFRKVQTFFGPCLMNIPHYNPATPDKLESLLYDLERYANCKDNIDPLIKAALIHYQFETIHPFEYGNGRIGRLLISVFLKQRNILSNHVLCLSRYLLINKINYFDRISQVQNIGDYGQWVKFFVKAFISSADHSINTINAYIKLRDNYIKKIMTLGKQAKNTMLLFEYIEKHPVFEISNVAESLNLSFSTVATATKNLEDLGILKCTNNQARNRCFA